MDSESEIQLWPESQQRDLTTVLAWMFPNAATDVTFLMKRLCAALKRGVFPP